METLGFMQHDQSPNSNARILKCSEVTGLRPTVRSIIQKRGGWCKHGPCESGQLRAQPGWRPLKNGNIWQWDLYGCKSSHPMQNFTGTNYLQLLPPDAFLAERWTTLVQRKWLSRAGLQGLLLKILHWAQPSSASFCVITNSSQFLFELCVKINIPWCLANSCFITSELAGQFLQFQRCISR